MPRMLSYEDKGTLIHSLCGATKLIFLFIVVAYRYDNLIL